MIEFMGKQLKNPLIASSCIATESVFNVLRLAENGVQGAILKSCADYERGKVFGKREFAVDKELGYTYASAPFESEILTLDECLEMLHTLRPQTEILLIPSFTASSLAPTDWIPACQQLEAAGADGIQLDFFYMGNIIGTDGLSRSIVSLLRELNAALRIPIMPKLNINLPKDYIIPLLVESGVTYVSLLDSVRSPYLRKTDGAYHISDRLDAETTSCFGHWQLPLTLGYTYTAAKHGLKVCAGGGITCADDVQKLLVAGAVTVQSASLLTKYIITSGHIVKEQLITASQLAAMPTGTALVMVDSQYKFIAHLPFYDEMYDNSKWKAPTFISHSNYKSSHSFDLASLVSDLRKKKLESLFSDTQKNNAALVRKTPFSQSSGSIDIDALVSRIDAKIAELEAEEEQERKETKKKHHVVITSCDGNRFKIAIIIANFTSDNIRSANEKLDHLPLDIGFSNKKEAERFSKEIQAAGGEVCIKSS